MRTDTLTIVNDAHIGMVLEVVAYSWEMKVDRDIVLIENFRISNTREFENLRSVHTSSCEDDLSRCGDIENG